MCASLGGSEIQIPLGTKEKKKTINWVSGRKGSCKLQCEFWRNFALHCMDPDQTRPAKAKHFLLLTISLIINSFSLDKKNTVSHLICETVSELVRSTLYNAKFKKLDYKSCPNYFLIKNRKKKNKSNLIENQIRISYIVQL